MLSMAIGDESGRNIKISVAAGNEEQHPSGDYFTPYLGPYVLWYSGCRKFPSRPQD